MKSPPASARSEHFRQSQPPRLWDELVLKTSRLLLLHLIWPVLAVGLIGGLGALLIPKDYLHIWLVAVLMTLLGAFIPLRWALALSSFVFVSYGTWLLWQVQLWGVGTERLLLLAYLPFAPLWLGALRFRTQRLIHLDALLTLPQVRAAMNISPWTLLPSARALDERLNQHLRSQPEGQTYPAFLVRIHFPRLQDEIDLLGEEDVQAAIAEVADGLRNTLRTGDWIAENLKDHGYLYALIFPNPYNPDYAAILRRLRPVFDNISLRHTIDYAVIPDDGDRLHNIHWHRLEAES